MPNYIKKIYSGDVYEVEAYYSPRKAGSRYTRGENINLTPEQQKEINLIQARKKLARLINTNFSKGDLFITLTHADRVNYEDARKELTKYIRKIRRERKKLGLTELKYIAVTENGKNGKGREHHHVIMSAMDSELAISLWQQGRAMISKLEPGGDYTGLANYITKEPKEEHKKRWSESRNLKQPRIIRKEVASSSRRRKFTVPKGYMVVQDYSYYSHVTGETHYMRAIRIGGTDYAYGASPPEREV